jgi:hypothetical protein
LASGSDAAARAALAPLDEATAFWHLPRGRALWWQFDHPDRDPEDIQLNLVQAMDGPSSSSSPSSLSAIWAQGVRNPVGPNLLQADPSAVLDWDDLIYESILVDYVNGTFPRGSSFLAVTESQSFMIATGAPWKQFEVAVPLEIAAECLEMAVAEVYDPAKELWRGFRTPINVRFVAGEVFSLSNTHGGPRMYLNMEDYVSLSLSTGEDNAEFYVLLDLFVNKCQGRLHWGKEGWPRHAACFDGAATYPDSWCDFGCAVDQLDPTGKFASLSPVWKWAARKDGQEVPFGACCGPEGFIGECQCASVVPQGCPGALEVVAAEGQP